MSRNLVRWMGLSRVLSIVGAGLLYSAGSSAFGQMVVGERMGDFGKALNVLIDQRTYAYNPVLAETSVPGNIMWPGDQPTWTIQFQNTSGAAIGGAGKIEVVRYGTRGIPGDVWLSEVFKIEDVASIPFDINLPEKGFQNVTITPHIPETLGGYAVIADLGSAGRRFVFSSIRTFKPTTERIQYPSLSLDDSVGDTLPRLGIQAIRYGVEWYNPDDTGYEKAMAELDAKMQDDAKKNITVMLMVGGSGRYQPLGQARPHLSDDGVMMQTKSDLAWLPSQDDNFQKWVTAVTSKYGWPHGPVTSMSLWNEPWEGISISGWGADMIRYRDIFRHMAHGIMDSRKDAGVQVLVAGCDSSTNTIDKLFPDESDEFLPLLDVCTIHYQGMDAPSTYKKWLNKTGPNGRIRIWDTESWVANVDDRVAAVVAANKSAGYDRAMGVFWGNLWDHKNVQLMVKGGKPVRSRVDAAWSTAASVGAALHFIGERKFNSLLFQNGLPWVMVFDGLSKEGVAPNPEDGTIVVVGDIGEEFGKNELLYRDVTGLKEVEELKAAKEKLNALPATASAAERTEALKQVAALATIQGGKMVMDDGGGKFSLFDFYGNPVKSSDGKITVPLDGRGFFLRADGSAGAFAALKNAVAQSHTEGFECVDIAPHDLLASVDTKPSLRITFTNVLNRPITGTLEANFGSLKLEDAGKLTFAANETRDVDLKMTDGAAVANNSYPLHLRFDAGADGFSVHDETMHVNLIAHRTITVDGNLDDWKGVLPQTIIAKGTAAPSMQEAAWFPFQKYDTSVKSGFATGYLAYDDNNFYFAAKVADADPDAGTMRFETRDDDQFYYPKVSYEMDPAKTYGTRPSTITMEVRKPFELLVPGSSTQRSDQTLNGQVTTIKMKIHLPTDRSQQVALYFLDNDDHEQGRQANDIEMTDATTGAKIADAHVKEFGSGTYAVFTLTGDVDVSIVSRTTYLSTGFAGLFFDETGSPPAAVTGGKKAFLGLDEKTSGNWQGVYGKGGYMVVGSPEKYPEGVSVEILQNIDKKEHVWPDGVRQYSYRKRPVLPSGDAPNFDNIQIAFNAIPLAEDPVMTSSPPGTPPMYIGYRDSDSQYALNKVADQYGGGTEIWRLEAPDHMGTNDFPRQPRNSWSGPVKSGKLVVVQDGSTRITEVAIPWTELPYVKKLLDAGKPVKFDFRVNDHHGLNGMELAWDRGVSRENNKAFQADWVKHWANELEFAFDKSTAPAAQAAAH